MNMGRRLPSLSIWIFVAEILARTALAGDAPAGLDAEKIGQTVGVKATTVADGVVRIAWPRDDVKVTIDGVPFAPYAGLGSWAAFKWTGSEAMVMGDTVVFQDEVDMAMSFAFQNGLEVTGLHNHFFYDEPKVFFMHIGGHGDPIKLATGVKAVWDAIRTVRAQQAEPAKQFAGDGIKVGKVDPEPIEKMLGQKSESKDGIVKVTIGRKGMMHGVEVGGSMGLTTWAAFTGTNENAVVDGDFIMSANEVQAVLRTLRVGGFHIVALHNHMIGEEPAFYFTHFWGKGTTERLAQVLKAALDEQGKAAAQNQPAMTDHK